MRGQDSSQKNSNKKKKHTQQELGKVDYTQTLGLPRRAIKCSKSKQIQLKTTLRNFPVTRIGARWQVPGGGSQIWPRHNIIKNQKLKKTSSKQQRKHVEAYTYTTHHKPLARPQKGIIVQNKLNQKVKHKTKSDFDNQTIDKQVKSTTLHIIEFIDVNQTSTSTKTRKKKTERYKKKIPDSS